MAYIYKSNKCAALKESTSEKQNNSATASKFKAVLVKDLLQSFEKPIDTISIDATQKKANALKITKSPYQKIRNSYKAPNREGSLQKSTFKNSKIASNMNDHESQKTEPHKFCKSTKKIMRDHFTMTSSHNNQSKSKSFLNLNNAKPVSSEMQNINIGSTPCNCANKLQFSNNFDSTNLVGIIQNIVTQLKTFLEQSVQVHEDQASKLKRLLNNVNDINTTISRCDSNKKDFSACDREGNLQNITTNTKYSSQANSKTLSESSPVLNVDNRWEESTKTEKRLSIPSLITLVSNDSNQEAKQLSMTRSYLPSKNVSESQVDYMSTTNARTPKSLKVPRRRTIAADSCEFQCRRRSLSTPSESDLDITQGSFTMLEKKLNIVHKKMSAKSLLDSPAEASAMTPGFAKQWDERSKRPLKEYMALKMQSTFLVTPDINWFQSRLKSADTDDLYSESGFS